MKAKWQWLCEVVYLLLHGWRPVQVDELVPEPNRQGMSSSGKVIPSGKRRWLWAIHEQNVTLHYLRANAYSKAKDRARYMLELRKALADSRHECDRRGLLLATALEVLNARGDDEADQLELDAMEVNLSEQIRAELAPKKKAAT